MNFLKPDSSLMQFLSRVADVMIVNCLFLVCSLPILTIGAAMTAAHKVTQDMVMQTDGVIAKSFLKTFRAEFRQSTAAWLLTLPALAILVYDALLIFWYFEGGLAVSLYLFLGVIAVLVIGTSVNVFALIARYSNTLARDIRNAFLLTLARLPRSVLIVTVTVLPPAIPLFFTGIFIRYIYVWIFFFFGLSFLAVSRLLKPVLLLPPETRAEEPDPE